MKILMILNIFCFATIKLGAQTINIDDIKQALHTVYTESSDSIELAKLFVVGQSVPELKSFIRIRQQREADKDRVAARNAIKALCKQMLKNSKDEKCLQIEAYYWLAQNSVTPEESSRNIEKAYSMLQDAEIKEDKNKWGALLLCEMAQTIGLANKVFEQHAWNKLLECLATDLSSENFCQLELYKTFLSFASKHHTEAQLNHYRQEAIDLAARLYPNSANERLEIEWLYINSMHYINCKKTGNAIRKLKEDAIRLNGTKSIYVAMANELDFERLLLIGNSHKACKEQKFYIKEYCGAADNFDNLSAKARLLSALVMSNQLKEARVISDEIYKAINRKSTLSSQQRFYLLEKLANIIYLQDYETFQLEDILESMMDITKQYKKASYIEAAMWYGLANVFLKMGRRSQAKEYINNAINTLKKNEKHTLLQQKTITCLELSVISLDVEFHSAVTDWTFAQSSSEQTIELAERLADNDLVVQQCLTTALLYNNNEIECKHLIEKAVKLVSGWRPDLNVELQLARAKYLLKDGNHQGALDIIDSLQQQDYLKEDGLLLAKVLESGASIIAECIASGKMSLSFYKQAELYLLNALHFYNQANATDNQVQIYSFLSNISFQQGEIAESQEYLKAAIDLYEKYNEVGYIGYLQLILQFAELCLDYGNIQTAYHYFINIASPKIINFKKIMADDSQIVGLIIQGTYLCYKIIAQEYLHGIQEPPHVLEQLENFADQAEQMYKEIAGNTDSPLYATFLAGKSLYMSSVHHDYEQALNITLQRDSIMIRLNVPINSEAFRISCLLQLRRYDEAKEIYEQACKKYNYEELTGTPAIGALFIGEQIYTVINQNEKAVDLARKRLDLIKEDVYNKFDLLNATERDAFMHSANYNPLDLYYHVAHHISPKSAALAYDGALFYKGILLRTSNNIRQTILNSKDSLLIADYNRLIELKQQQLRLVSTGLDTTMFTNSVMRLQYDIDQIDKRLLMTSAKYRDFASTANHTPQWRDVQNSLGENDAAIEFIIYPDSLGAVKGKYGALILTKSIDAPIFVPLLDDDTLRSIVGVKQDEEAEKDRIHFTYRPHPTSRFRPQKQHDGKDLYERLWLPLEKHLLGKTRIFYSPIGSLFEIAFAAIEDSTGNPICKKYDLRLVSNTARILNPDYDITTIQDARLYGSITYGEKVDGYGMDSLLNSFVEISVVDSIFNSHGIPSKTFYGKVSEPQIKNISIKCPSVLLMSTHGFFFRNPEEAKNIPFFDGYLRRGIKSPLFWGGLALADINPVLYGKRLAPTESDGVLLSYEVADMNLRGTNLVVLSACQTGLGGYDLNEGINGLSRAFRMAGASSVIMSLWEVDDNATQIFMKRFFHNILTDKKHNRHKAFNQTQKELEKEYKNAPRLWAAFVLLD